MPRMDRIKKNAGKIPHPDHPVHLVNFPQFLSRVQYTCY